VSRNANLPVPGVTCWSYCLRVAFTAWRVLIVLAMALATLASCSSSKSRETAPTPAKRPVDYQALETAIENKISSGSVALDNVRAVLVSVDGESRSLTTATTSRQRTRPMVWSITKSVMSTLIGSAISDGIIDSLDQTLAELLSSTPVGDVRWSS
jgi:CubicO group peptidase (beta-lactamase class C family)